MDVAPSTIEPVPPDSLLRHRLPRVARRHAPVVVTTVTLAVLALIVLSSWSVASEGLLDRLREVRPWWLAVAFALVMLVEAVKTARWLVLLALPPGSFGDAFVTILISRFLNALGPVRAGDVWRVGSVVRREKKDLVVVGAALMMEKALDAAMLGVAGALVLGLVAIHVGWAAGLLLLGVAGGSLALIRWRWPHLWTSTVDRLAALQHLRRSSTLASLVGTTLAAMAIGVLVNLAVLEAVGLPVDPVSGLGMLLTGYAAGLLPALPGQLGVFELAVSGPLIAAGHSPGGSVAAAIALHGVLLLMVTVGGVFLAAIASRAAVDAARPEAPAWIPRRDP